MEIGLCVCAFTWAFAWAMCVVFHRKSMIFHSIFSHRIRLSVYWRIKTQLQEHARKSASFPSMASGSMCSQFFNHMKRCDGRDVWSETDGNDVTKCFGYDFSCLSLLEAEKEIEKKVRAHKHTHTVTHIFCGSWWILLPVFRLVCVFHLLHSVHAAYTLYKIWVYEHKYMSIPQHLTPLPLKPFKQA